MANLSLGYPPLNLGGGNSMMSFLARIKAAKMKFLPRTSSRGRRSSSGGRDSELADAISVSKHNLELEKFDYEQEQDEIAGQRTDRQFAFDVQKEGRQEADSDFKEMKYAEDREKAFLYKMIDLHTAAGKNDNVAFQRNIEEQMMRYPGSLSPEGRALAMSVLRTGPFSEVAQKVRRFEETNPRQSITADPETEPHAWAKQVTYDKNWLADRSGIATGTRPTVQPLESVGEGIYLSTENGGQIVTEELLGLKDMAKAGNIPLLKLLTDGGFYASSRTVTTGGIERTVANFTDLKGNVTARDISEKRLPENKELHNFISQWGGWEDLSNEDREKRQGSPVAEVKRRQERGDNWPQISAEYFKPRYAMNLIHLAEEPADWTDWPVVNWFTEDRDLGKLIARPGDLVDIQGTMVYYDTVEDQVYNEFNGRALGDLQTATEYLRLVRAKRREESGGTF